MLVVTGAAGFIGCHLMRALNDHGCDDILVVDDLEDGTKFKNIVDCELLDYVDKEVFLTKITNDSHFVNQIKVIFHQGACSTTTEWNGRFMMQNNYEYSKSLLHCCLNSKIPFIYASSAAVYGNSNDFKEHPHFEKPLNVYGYSKLQFDRYVRRVLPTAQSQVVGLRYFNVYGPREQHKGGMASVVWHFYHQLVDTGRVKLFEGIEGYQNGEQRRDFVYVKDVANINVWFWKQEGHKGIYNVGTGQSCSFNEVANAVIEWHGSGEIEYIPFPHHLRRAYQSFTQADITALRNAGYSAPFTRIKEGVSKYLEELI